MPDPDHEKKTPEPYRSRLGDIPEDAFDNDPKLVEDPEVGDDMADWLDELRKRRSPAKP
jgi:hypothetical protein